MTGKKMWPQTNFEKKVFVKMILKLRRSKSQSDLRKVKSSRTLCRILMFPLLQEDQASAGRRSRQEDDLARRRRRPRPRSRHQATLRRPEVAAAQVLRDLAGPACAGGRGHVRRAPRLLALPRLVPAHPAEVAHASEVAEQHRHRDAGPEDAEAVSGGQAEGAAEGVGARQQQGGGGGGGAEL